MKKQRTIMPALVSILIPVYNRASILPETLDSAISQTYSNIEIIIVDNHSTDDTWNIIQNYAKLDSRIKSFRNETNIGPVRNWRVCIEKASGEFGKILFSDDIIESTFIEKTLPYLEDKEVSFVFTGINTIKGVGAVNECEYISSTYWKQTSNKYPSKMFIYDALFKNGIVPCSPSAALFRLDDLKINLIDNLPFFKNFVHHGSGLDLLIFLLTANNYSKVAFVANPLVTFRGLTESLTVKYWDSLSLYHYQAKLWFVDNSIHYGIVRKKLFISYLIFKKIIKSMFK